MKIFLTYKERCVLYKKYILHFYDFCFFRRIFFGCSIPIIFWWKNSNSPNIFQKLHKPQFSITQKNSPKYLTNREGRGIIKVIIFFFILSRQLLSRGKRAFINLSLYYETSSLTSHPSQTAPQEISWLTICRICCSQNIRLACRISRYN